jgi:6-phosphogluconolactonase (cycloisomerase 2 family)
MPQKTVRVIATAAAMVAAAFGLAPAAQASQANHGSTGAVYVLGNQPSGNAVIAYDRGADGRLSSPRSYPTGGTGTGGGLGSQNAVVLDASAHHLYAVNAGSDSITSFDVTRDGLRWRSTVPSGGDLPVSVTVRGNRVYALNAGGTGNISGFTVHDGKLTPLPGSTRALSGDATSPAQVSFSPNGRELVVTEKATNLIDVYRLNGKGLSTGRTSFTSAGATPFGFSFTPSGYLAVSEAGPSSASTYRISAQGVKTVSAAVGNTEAAACWLVVTGNGKYAYTGNGGGSQSISGYRVSESGRLSLLTPDGRTGTAAAGVSDIALSASSDFLYARLGDGTVGAYRVARDGGLDALPVSGGLPAGAAGVAAR